MTHTTPESQSTSHELSAIAEKLIQAVENEIKAEIFPRHTINKLSPSFPYNHRTLANRDALNTGISEFLMLGGRRFITKKSTIDFLRRELAKPLAKKSQDPPETKNT